MVDNDPNDNVLIIEPLSGFRKSKTATPLKADCSADNGRKGFHDVFETRPGLGETSGGLRRTTRNKSCVFQDKENGGDGDTNVASEGEDDDADDDANADANDDAKKSFWAALFCCKIFRK